MKTHPYADIHPIPLQDPDARTAIDRLHDLYYGANPYTAQAMREAITELAAHYGLQVVDTSPISESEPDLLRPETGKPNRPGKLTNLCRRCSIFNRQSNFRRSLKILDPFKRDFTFCGKSHLNSSFPVGGTCGNCQPTGKAQPRKENQ